MVGREEFTDAQNEFIDRCGELVRNGQNQTPENTPVTRDALVQIASEEVATQGTTSVETAGVQLANVGARLAALRRGATGISFQGLALNIHGKTLPGPMLASLIPFDKMSDAASVSEPSMVHKPGMSLPQRNTFSDIRSTNLVAQSGSSSASTDKPSMLNRFGLFVNGTFSIGDKDITSKESGFDFHTLGVTAGIDYRLTENLVLGTAFGFASTDADIDPFGGGGDLDTNEYSFSFYGLYYIQDFYINGITNFGWNTYDSTRNIIYTLPTTDPTGMPIVTTVNQTAKGDTHGSHFSLGFGAGYDFRSGGFTFGPFARLNYIKVDIDGYQESVDTTTPGFGWVLAVDGQDVESFTSAIGGQVSYAFSTQVGVFVPQFLFEWEHEFDDNSRPTTARFVHDPSSVPINITTDDPDRNYFNLGAGLSAVFQGGKSAFLYYETVLGLDDVTAHNLVVGARLEF
jgi:outer membrane autotransporter protein